MPTRCAASCSCAATAPAAKPVESAKGPAPGTVWVDAAVIDSLGLKVGDPLLLGDASLTVANVILIEPDRGTGFASFAPRVMLNVADLDATGLIQPASRVTYRLAVASPRGSDAKVAEFVAWAEAELKAKALRGMRIESLASGRPEMRQTLDRAEKFLNLVALLAALLAAVAVAIASRDFASRHLDDCAMLRVLGLPQRTIALQYFIEFALIGVLASAVGVALGFAVHYVFICFLAGLVEHGAAAAERLAGAVRRRRRLHPAVRLRRAAGAAAGAGAAAARDPARRRRPQAGVDRGARRRRGRLRRPAARGGERPQARPDRGRRLRRRRLRVRAAVVAGARAAAPLGARGRRAALAGAGDAADRRPARLRRAAGLGARGRPARPGAARPAAHRPDLELAPGDAARTRRTASSSTCSRPRPRRSGRS